MVEVTDVACKELDAYFADKEKGTIRIYLAPGGCSGPHLGLALDDAGDDDSTFDVKGYNFCIGKDLLGKVEGVTIDLSYMGFVVEPRIPLPKAAGCSCSGCGGSSSCGG